MNDCVNLIFVEIKLKSDEFIIKDKPEEIRKVRNANFKFDMNLPTNSEIKTDSLLCGNFSKDVATSTDNSFNSKLQIKVEQKEENESHLIQETSISNVDQVTVKCAINIEIKLEEEELIIKDEPEEVEESSSLEFIKHVNFNLQDNVERQCEDEDCASQELSSTDFDQNTFECKICSLYVPPGIFKQHMLYHKNTKHKLGKHEVIHAKQKCSEHGQKDVKVNKQVHSDQKLFQCSKCNICFTGNYNIKQHMLLHEDKKLFKCLQCDKTFSRNSHLKSHVLIHGNKRPFHCQQCGKGFTQNSHLKVHMVTHETNGLFNCQRCDKKFTQKCNLKTHMLLHENKRRFNCQQCGKDFTQNRDLKAHMIIHEDKRPFNCQLCDKGFTRNDRFQLHMLWHENKKPFACQQCDQGYTRNDRLKVHMLRHEREKPTC